jgi:molybdate transport system regulatory protein
MPKTSARPLPKQLVPRHKVWLNWGSSFLLGPNYLRFFEAIETTGTIREAAKAAGWSYRTSLNRVRRVEAVLGRPVLITVRGGSAHGGARLTPEIRRTVKIFAKWRAEMHRVADTAFRRVSRG